MKALSLYPLRFAPMYQYRLWGGRRLARFLSAPLPGQEPIGEAWLLSDREDHASRVADGPLEGQSIGELSERFPQQLLGPLTAHFERFPLLLKLLDVQQPLSVQVHPSDADRSLIPLGETGKTEAWVVLEAGPQAHIFAGLRPGSTAASLRRAIDEDTVVDQLAGFTPGPGDAVLIPAGTVHSLADVVVFEVQQNSDVTFRLYDWDHIDPRSCQRRPLQVAQALACIDFAQHAIRPLTPQVQATQPAFRAQILLCEHFGVTRISAEQPFVVGKTARPRVLFCLAGTAELAHDGHRYPFGAGEVVLLPAAIGECACVPRGTVRLLEISLPEPLLTS